MNRFAFILILLNLLLMPTTSGYAQMLVFDEVKVTLKTESGDINGKLLYGGEAECVALLIAGSGPTDMDGNSSIANMKNNSLKMLAGKLADSGIASLRFDKRGVASSVAAAKKECDLRFEDYVNDVVGWVDCLSKDYGFKKIIIIGHSEGALIGMLACQMRPKLIKGYVSLAGAGRPAYELIEEQIAEQQLPEAIREEVASINESLKTGREVADVPNCLQALFRTSVQPYLISWYKYNPQTVISTLVMPILVVQGEMDIQVSVQEAKLLKKACSAARLLVINSMNHVLKDCNTKDRQAQQVVYASPLLPLNVELVSGIISFIEEI